MEERKEAESILHKLAMRAKERLKKGNYCEEKSMERAKKPCSLRLVCGESSKPEISIKTIERTQDAKLYKKVQQLMEEENEIVMPLAKLIDQENYKKMTDIEQERYMLQLSDNYLKLKQYFEHEKFKTA